MISKFTPNELNATHLELKHALYNSKQNQQNSDDNPAVKVDLYPRSNYNRSNSRSGPLGNAERFRTIQCDQENGM